MPIYSNPNSYDIEKPSPSSIMMYQNQYGTYAVPQIVKDDGPVLYTKNGIKLKTNKYLIIYQDPAKGIPTYTRQTTLGSYVNTYGCFNVVSLANYKSYNKNSGLSYSLEQSKNPSSGASLSNASLRVNVSSISTTYLNVFRWVAFEKDNDTYRWNYDDIQRNTLTYFDNYSSGVGMTSGWYSSDYIANGKTFGSKKINLFNKYVTIKKSSTYIHIHAPFWNGANSAADVNYCHGWGIILEPTNTNEYPE